MLPQVVEYFAIYATDVYMTALDAKKRST